MYSSIYVCCSLVSVTVKDLYQKYEVMKLLLDQMLLLEASEKPNKSPSC